MEPRPQYKGPSVLLPDATGPKADTGGLRPLPLLWLLLLWFGTLASSRHSGTWRADKAVLGTPGTGSRGSQGAQRPSLQAILKTRFLPFSSSLHRGGASHADHLLHQLSRASLCASPTLSRDPTGTGTASERQDLVSGTLLGPAELRWG